MIDTHCHIDLYKNPTQLIKECEKAGIITIGMTNLPSHFEMGYEHVLPFNKVRLALGMHPLYAQYHEAELGKFFQNLHRTSYIGEVGLDYSKDGIATKEIQIGTFKKILGELSGKKKILSLHSRRAEKDVLNFLIEYKIKNAIFHWYSGPLSLIDDIIKAGYYFSINTAMTQSNTGQAVIKKIPANRILPESDGPFIEVEYRPAEPKDTALVYNYLSGIWNTASRDTEITVSETFQNLLTNIKK